MTGMNDLCIMRGLHLQLSTDVLRCCPSWSSRAAALQALQIASRRHCRVDCPRPDGSVHLGHMVPGCGRFVGSETFGVVRPSFFSFELSARACTWADCCIATGTGFTRPDFRTWWHDRGRVSRFRPSVTCLANSESLRISHNRPGM